MTMSITREWKRLVRILRAGRDERGVSLMITMIVTLMVGVLGVAALTMSGLENSMAGAMRMIEEGTTAAESCVGMGVKVIQESIDNGTIPAPLVAPAGPVPAGNAVILGQEINFLANSPDIAFGTGVLAPNLVMNVNSYTVNGDVDLQYRQKHPGTTALDVVYRVDCQAQNVASGATSRVIANYQCLFDAQNGATTCSLRNL